MSDPALKDCPECGNEIRRLIFGGTGVIFKGSGFYVTDKGKAPKPASGKTEKPAEKTDTPAPAPTACSECPRKGTSAACPA